MLNRVKDSYKQVLGQNYWSSAFKSATKEHGFADDWINQHLANVNKTKQLTTKISDNEIGGIVIVTDPNSYMTVFCLAHEEGVISSLLHKHDCFVSWHTGQLELQNFEFNNCMDGKLPDVRLFSDIEVLAVFIDEDGHSKPCAYFEEVEQDGKRVYTVFGRYIPTNEHDGLEALHDCDSLEDAMKLAKKICDAYSLSFTPF